MKKKSEFKINSRHFKFEDNFYSLKPSAYREVEACFEYWRRFNFQGNKFKRGTIKNTTTSFTFVEIKNIYTQHKNFHNKQHSKHMKHNRINTTNQTSKPGTTDPNPRKTTETRTIRTRNNNNKKRGKKPRRASRRQNFISAGKKRPLKRNKKTPIIKSGRWARDDEERRNVGTVTLDRPLSDGDL